MKVSLIGVARGLLARKGLSLSDARYGFEDLVAILHRRHEVLMAARPDKKPGEFKTEANFAGATAFVEPELVVGTLRRGFELFRSLREPFARAAFMMFLISEVHPFVDGNGRIARIMTNAELLAEGQHRIIIPTVYREDYLLVLRSLTRQGRTDPFLRMLDRAQEFVSRIDFQDMDGALTALREANAFSEPSDARLNMPREESR
ncbi:MAG: Fic family protein [Longimicrobiales bacterium]